MLKAAPRQHGGHDEGDDLEGADRDRDGQVAEHHERSGDRRGEEVSLAAALAIDDHADAAEHAAERDEQADGSDGDKAQIVDRPPVVMDLARAGAMTTANSIGREQRDEDLARRVRAEAEAPRGQVSRRRRASMGRRRLFASCDRAHAWEWW